MKKYLALFCLALACLSGLAAEEDKVVFDRYPSALGFYADSSGIYGLTFQRWNGPWGIQAALSANVSTAGSVMAGAVAEGAYRLYADDYSNWLSGALYLAALGGYRYSSDVLADPNYGEVGGILGGVGLGFEVALFKHFSLNLQFLYRAATLPKFSLGFGVGSSLTYRF